MLIESFPLVVVKSIHNTLDHPRQIIKEAHSDQTKEKFDRIIDILVKNSTEKSRTSLYSTG